jgi:hypothetical protein
VTLSFFVGDGVRPVVSITAPTAAAAYETASATVALAGTASDNIGVSRVSWSSNRGVSGTATGTTNWAASVALQSGVNVITVTAQDAAGNSATAVSSVTYLVPVTPLSPSGSISTATPAFSWTPVPGAGKYVLLVHDAVQLGKIMLQVTPTQAGCAAGGMCTVSPGVALAQGSARWTVQTLGAGTDGPWSVPMSFTVLSPDTIAPLVTITTPTTKTSYTTKSKAALSVAGTATDNLGVTAVSWSSDRGVSGTASGTSSWVVSSIPLQVGSNVITITARDKAGNSGVDVMTIWYWPPHP